MKAVYQRVQSARVTVDGETVGEIGHGVLLLVGVMPQDDERHARILAKKTAELRVFPDERDRMDRSVRDIGGGVLAVSQFTLCANTGHGRRPDFSGAARPEIARPLFDTVLDELRQQGVGDVQSGRFGADMQVELINDGPVTLILDTADWIRG